MLLCMFTLLGNVYVLYLEGRNLKLKSGMSKLVIFAAKFKRHREYSCKWEYQHASSIIWSKNASVRWDARSKRNYAYAWTIVLEFE